MSELGQARKRYGAICRGLFLPLSHTFFRLSFFRRRLARDSRETSKSRRAAAKLANSTILEMQIEPPAAALRHFSPAQVENRKRERERKQ